MEAGAAWSKTIVNTQPRPFTDARPGSTAAAAPPTAQCSPPPARATPPAAPSPRYEFRRRVAAGSQSRRTVAQPRLFTAAPNFLDDQHRVESRSLHIRRLDTRATINRGQPAHSEDEGGRTPAGHESEPRPSPPKRRPGLATRRAGGGCPAPARALPGRRCRSSPSAHGPTHPAFLGWRPSLYSSAPWVVAPPTGGRGRQTPTNPLSGRSSPCSRRSSRPSRGAPCPRRGRRSRSRRPAAGRPRRARCRSRTAPCRARRPRAR